MRPRARLLVLAVVAIGVVAAAPLVGMAHLPLTVLLSPSAADPESVIMWQIRVPRVLAAFLGGAGLGLGGAAFQSMFRNPLATPYTLGVAGGASFGVALASRLGLAISIAGLSMTPVAAFAGALLAVLLVWTITRLRPDFSSMVLLLAGVAMSFFFSSLILFLQYTASLGHSFRIVRWLMGGLGAIDLSTVLQMLPFVVAGGAVVAWHARELDLLAIGTDIAASRGVAVMRTRKILFFATSVMVGGVVAACGPVGFVGMMAPHICRLIVGPDHRLLLPATCLFGGAFLTLCDTAARTVIAPVELPVGVITAFLGGPFFLWLLLRRVSTAGLR